MLTVVRAPAFRTRPADPRLHSDLAAFDRKRALRAPVLRVCLGFAIVVLLGAVVGDYPVPQAATGAMLCLAPAAAVAIVDTWQKRQLWRRLDKIRTNTRLVRKS